MKFTVQVKHTWLHYIIHLQSRYLFEKWKLLSLNHSYDGFRIDKSIIISNHECVKEWECWNADWWKPGETRRTHKCMIFFKLLLFQFDESFEFLANSEGKIVKNEETIGHINNIECLADNGGLSVQRIKIVVNTIIKVLFL